MISVRFSILFMCLTTAEYGRAVAFGSERENSIVVDR